jgi:hypothetical protein
MDGILRTTSLMAALALLATACGPGADRTGQLDNDTIRADGTPVTRVDLQQVRTDVDSIVSELRSEVEAMRGQVREDRVDRWTQLTSNVEETRVEVMEDLRAVDMADQDEARRIRDRTSERLAEIEADVARNEIELTHDAQMLQQRVDQHVQRLQSDLGYLQDQLRQYQGRDREDEGWFGFGNGLDQDNLADWQEELAEVQSDLRERTAEGDDVDDIASDLGDRVADLTRDIREQVHAVRWGARDRMN